MKKSVFRPEVSRARTLNGWLGQIIVESPNIYSRLAITSTFFFLLLCIVLGGVRFDRRIDIYGTAFYSHSQPPDAPHMYFRFSTTDAIKSDNLIGQTLPVLIHGYGRCIGANVLSTVVSTTLPAPLDDHHQGDPKKLGDPSVQVLSELTPNVLQGLGSNLQQCDGFSVTAHISQSEGTLYSWIAEQ